MIRGDLEISEGHGPCAVPNSLRRLSLSDNRSRNSTCLDAATAAVKYEGSRIRCRPPSPPRRSLLKARFLLTSEDGDTLSSRPDPNTKSWGLTLFQRAGVLRRQWLTERFLFG